MNSEPVVALRRELERTFNLINGEIIARQLLDVVTPLLRQEWEHGFQAWLTDLAARDAPPDPLDKTQIRMTRRIE